MDSGLNTTSVTSCIFQGFKFSLYHVKRWRIILPSLSCFWLLCSSLSLLGILCLPWLKLLHYFSRRQKFYKILQIPINCQDTFDSVNFSYCSFIILGISIWQFITKHSGLIIIVHNMYVMALNEFGKGTSIFWSLPAWRMLTDTKLKLFTTISQKDHIFISAYSVHAKKFWVAWLKVILLIDLIQKSCLIQHRIGYTAKLQKEPCTQSIGSIPKRTLMTIISQLLPKQFITRLSHIPAV